MSSPPLIDTDFMIRSNMATICAVLAVKLHALSDEGSEVLKSALGDLRVVPAQFSSTDAEAKAATLRRLCDTSVEIPRDGLAAKALIQAADTFTTLASATGQQMPFTEYVD